MTFECCDCHIVHLRTNSRQKRCKPCAKKEDNRLKRQGQKARRARGVSDDDRKDHLSEAEVDRIFNAALKEAKRKSQGGEPFRSYDFLYREPRG